MYVNVVLNKLTRMHSSRMRTGRSLTVCCSLLSGWGGWGVGCLVQGGAWSGGVCLVRGVSAPGGVWSGGGVSGPGGGVSGLGGGFPACTEADTPPPLWTDTRL